MKNESENINPKIKVVHVTTIDCGGAFKAVTRMNQCMNSDEIESQILVRTKKGSSPYTTECFNNICSKSISKIKNGTNLFFKRGEIYRDLLGTDISRNRVMKEADVIFLHWINSFLSFNSIKKLFKLQKPIVWVMHDMWLFTGGCHYDILTDCFCGKYEKGCGYCPLLKVNRNKDITRKNYIDKQKLFANNYFLVTGPSKWIVKCANESHIFSKQNIQYLPNCYDQSIFYRKENLNDIYSKFHIYTTKKVILFGSARSQEDNEIKGIKYLVEALKYLSPEDYLLLVFGTANDSDFTQIRQERHLLGFIEDEKEMAEIYNISDVYVSPSRQESFGYTVCEAMACGTPVVAFAVGGIRDQITHTVNGYLASEQNSEDLAKGIEYCTQQSRILGAEAEKAAQKFSYINMKATYTSLVKQIDKYLAIK